MAHDVFISYATEDKRVADSACAAIEARGFRCWMAPRDVVAGMSYGEAITKAIQGCRAMVLVFSANANTSSHIPKEVERAVTRDLAIIPFRIEDVPPSDRLDYFISSLHWLDAIGGPIDSHTARLADAVEQTLAGGGASAAKPSAQRRTLWGKISSFPAAGVRALGRRPAILAAVAAGVAAVIAGVAGWTLKPSPAVPRPVSRFTITLPAGQQLAGADQRVLALSPDGSQLAYVAVLGGSQQIYLRAMDSIDTKPIPGTEGATEPFFSPDGQWVGFFAGGKLKKISVRGGAVVTLCDASSPRGASWGSQGIVAFTPLATSALLQVSDAGGTPQLLTRLDKGENSNRWPEFLPGGKDVLFTAGTAVPGVLTNAQVAVQSVATGERRNFVQGTQPRYASSGHLVYAQGGNLMAAPFDPQRLAVTGAAVPVVEGVLQSRVTGAAQYSLSAAGSLVYLSGGVQVTPLGLVWVSRNGAEQPLAAPAHAYAFPRLSPDGRRIAVSIQEQESQVSIYDLSRETLTRLTFDGNANNTSAWTPDGKRIAFQSNQEGPPNLFWKLADGSGGLERLTTSENNQSPSSWSPDGQLLAFIELNRTTGNEIWMLRLSDHKAQPFLRTQFNEGAPRFSPDGRWLVYPSDESGRYEVYVQPYPGPGGKYQISSDGGTEPVWNPNGREVFYRSGGKVMAVDIATQPSFTVGKPRMLFEGPYQPTATTFANYDVSPDGQRFLMLKPIAGGVEVRTQINVVLNWFEELRQKVPTGTK